MSWEDFDKWTDRPRNILILCLIAALVGGGLAAIDDLTKSDSQKDQMFYFCSLPYPAEMKNKTPLTGVNCFT